MTALSVKSIEIDQFLAPPPPRLDAQPPLAFQQAATTVLAELQRAVASLLASASGETRRVADVVRTFGVDHRLGWQIHKIANAPTPLAVGANVPARVSMQKLLKAASRRKVPANVVKGVSEAFDQYEQLVEEHAGDRAELEAMLSAFLPEEREKQELASKQAAFKAMSDIRGVASDATTCTFLLHPSSTAARVDQAVIAGSFGLRRVRPGTHIAFWSVSVETPEQEPLNLAGEPASGPHGTLLREFCSDAALRIEVDKRDNLTNFWLAGQEVGLRAAVDLVSAEHRPAATGRYRAPGLARNNLFEVADTPTKRLTLDVFVHRDLYPNASPYLAIYQTITRGIVRKYGDPAREHDRLHLHEIIRAITGGVSQAHLPHVPRYVEMLEHACGRLKWDAASFRGYRLDVQYPVYGAQYMIGFELPEKPADAE
jgi:hypothetical protein